MQPTFTDAAHSSTAAVRGKFRVVFLNSTACYLIAYQLISFIYQAGTAAAAHRLGVPGTWNLAGVRFELGDSGWTQAIVLQVYSAGPLLALAVGALAFGLYWKRQRHRRGLAKLLLLWVVLHALGAVLGGLLADSITQSGSWYVPNWLIGAGGTWPSMVLALLLAAGQLVLGYVGAVVFLLTQDSHTVLQFERRPQLVRATIFGPWLVGSALLALSKWPYLSLNEGLRYATLLLLLLPLALGCLQESFNQKKWTPSPTRLAGGLLVLAGLALVAWRLALAGGVRL
ncbi:MAG TPA: hypothetical protein VFO93_07440 [Hymenobacter sp.]|uniref:hypothetical protein n=1 Tax=Hymenobacter sp. TaxID=1898978 RepID=UPI002D7F1A53|nr:hypothetical protein [Hymenobacter sp.]HET9503357.1 hypothetical protein [Hymenobacter sp.]